MLAIQRSISLSLSLFLFRYLLLRDAWGVTERTFVSLEGSVSRVGLFADSFSDDRIADLLGTKQEFVTR